MDTIPGLYTVGSRGVKPRRQWCVIAGVVLLVLGILAATAVAVIAVGLGIAGWFLPLDNGGAYFVGNDNQGGAYQFYQAHDQVNPADIDISAMGSITNDNTKDAGLMWFQSLGILGTHGQQMEAQNIRNGMGTAFLVRDGNAEISEGSLWVKGTIYANNLEIPSLTELIKGLSEQLDMQRIGYEQLQQQIENLSSLPQQWAQWKEQQ